jgi:hypothetical protein
VIEVAWQKQRRMLKTYDRDDEGKLLVLVAQASLCIRISPMPSPPPHSFFMIVYLESVPAVKKNESPSTSKDPTVRPCVRLPLFSIYFKFLLTNQSMHGLRALVGQITFVTILFLKIKQQQQ